MNRPAGAAGRFGDRRLGESVAALDAAGFVGRVDLLETVEAMLDGSDQHQILFVHGPGGAGKSALLREVGRRARSAGRPVQVIDGRLLEVSTESLAQACAPAVRASGGVILIDSFEQIHALALVLRDEILPTLAADSVVVIAGRRRPGAVWFRDGWEHLAHEVALRPLTDDEADQLLAQNAIRGADATRLRRWAKGSPLALRVAASAPSGKGAVDDGDLAATIVSRLVGDDFDDADAELLAVAAVARAVDERLIADVLPHRDAAASYRDFRDISLTEPYGHRLALHDVVRDALRVDLQRRDPDTFRRLVCRTADHLHDRVFAGEYGLLGEMSDLLMDPFIRTAYSAGRGSDYRAGQPEPGDSATLARLLNCETSQWWPKTARFFDDAPELVTVVRSSRGDLVGFGIATTRATAPEWISDDSIVPVLEALVRSRFGDAIVPIWRDFVTLLAPDDPARADVFALLNHPPLLAADLARSRAVFGAIPLVDVNGWALRTAVGAERIGPDIVDGERILGGYLIDNGPGLLIGNVRDQVYAGQQLAPPREGAAAALAIEAAVRTALMHFHDPVALAANPLAEGADVSSRAESVRSRLRSALDPAYGPASDSNQLRRAIERGYLDPSGSHERAMAELHLSRSTYFRTLKKARAQLVAAMAAG